MPFVTEQNLIEKSDFSGGWSPDGDPSATVDSVLPDVLNLLLDLNSGSVRTRAGFKRLREEFSGGALTADHHMKQIFEYVTTAFERYLICVLTDDTHTADNVQLWYIKLSNLAVARIDTPGVEWDRPESRFFGLSVEGTFYGGSKDAKMFSWDGTTYDADCSTGNPKTLMDEVGAGIDVPTEYARDNAFTGKEIVSYGGSKYRPVRDIRFTAWESGQIYSVGDRVSRKTDGYWTSWRCFSRHTGDTDTAPNTGADYAERWKKVRLALPTNEDDETTNDWALMPPIAQGPVAAWWQSRMWLRYDGQGDLSRVQYSAPLKPEKGADVPDLVFNPTDWAPSAAFDGGGGGWIPLGEGGEHRNIMQLVPFGNALLVFTRFSVQSLTGADDSTWEVKQVSRNYGSVGFKSAAVHAGLCYFLSYEGLCVTDGTTVQIVPGNEKVRNYLRARLEGLNPLSLIATGDATQAELTSWNGYLIISMPFATDDEPYVTLFYDPLSQSFWKTNLPVSDMITYHRQGDEKLVFVAGEDYAAEDPVPLVYEYDHADSDDTDDTGMDTYAGADIAWYLRTAWLPFGTHREQRRIRRIWWVVKGALDFTITQYRDWLDAAQATTARTSSDLTTRHIEGVVQPDSHAVAMKLSGTEAPAHVYGYAVDTQPRRARYHSGTA